MENEKITELDMQTAISKDVKMIPIDQIDRNYENVNVMSDVEFNDLVAKIQKRGFDQPVKVWWNPEINKYEVIKGNHRFEAAKFLGFKEIPCIVGQYEHRDDAMADGISDNITRGQIDPEKFTKEYNKLKKKYGIDKTMAMMTISSQKTLAKLIKEARDMLPDDLKRKFDEAKKDIKDIDDLSLILNTLFTEYGHTLDYGFMFFTFGGHIQLMVRMTKRLRLLTEKLTNLCEKEKTQINGVFEELISKWLTDKGEKISEEEALQQVAEPSGA